MRRVPTQGFGPRQPKRKTDPLDAKIERIYGKHCSGMQISIMRIPELFRLAKIQLEGGVSEDKVGEWMINFVRNER